MIKNRKQLREHFEAGGVVSRAHKFKDEGFVWAVPGTDEGVSQAAVNWFIGQGLTVIVAVDIDGKPMTVGGAPPEPAEQ